MKETLFNINWGDGDTFYIIAPDEKTAIGKMTDGRDMVNYVVKLDAVYKMIFRAGYDKALAQLADMTEECKQIGRREVVEWIEMLYPFGSEQHPEIISFLYKLRAKLKDWGIE